MEEMKVCSKCGVEKNVEEFYVEKKRNSRRSECIKCTLIKKKEYRDKNKDKIKKRKEDHKEEISEYNKRYKEEHSEFYKEYNKKYAKDHPDQRKIQREKYSRSEKQKACYRRYYHKHKNEEEFRSKNIENAKRYKETHPEKVREWNKISSDRIRADPQKKLKSTVSCMINGRLRKRGSSKKGKSTFHGILPYTVEDLMAHLESLFEPGMTWENHGKGDGNWQIDHIIPDSYFKYSDVTDEEFQKSFALDNLQPMWGSENSKKSNKYVGKFRPNFYKEKEDEKKDAKIIDKN